MMSGYRWPRLREQGARDLPAPGSQLSLHVQWERGEQKQWGSYLPSSLVDVSKEVSDGIRAS
jgi:hypothetical protein